MKTIRNWPSQQSMATAAAFAAAAGCITCCDRKPSMPPVEAVPAPPPSAVSQPAHSSDDIPSRVAKQIVDILGVPVTDVTAEKEIVKDLGADSLDTVEIVMALEEEFNLSIDDAAAAGMHKVSDIVGYIRTHIKQVKK